MSEIRKNLGGVTAYAYARSKGYTGTEEEFAQLMANYATVGETATEAAEQATTKAGEASTSATNAASSASAASASATAAAGSASAAATSETNAAASATAASGSATQAATSASAAQAAQAAAEEVAESIPEDYSELSADVDDLKNALNGNYYNASRVGRSSVNRNDGSIIDNYGGYTRTDYIPIFSDYIIIDVDSSQSGSSQDNCFYDASKNFISSFRVWATNPYESGITGFRNVFKVPSNAKYFICSGTNAFMSALGVVNTKYRKDWSWLIASSDSKSASIADVVCHGTLDDGNAINKFMETIVGAGKNTFRFAPDSTFTLRSPIRPTANSKLVSNGATFTQPNMVTTTIDQDASSGSTSIHVLDVTGFDHVEMWVYIEDSQGNYEANYITNYDISTHTITLKYGLKYTYLANNSPAVKSANSCFLIRHRHSQDDITIDGVNIDWNVSGNPQQTYNPDLIQDGFSLDECKNITIKNCTIKNGGRRGICGYDATNILVENCYIENWSEHGIDWYCTREKSGNTATLPILIDAKVVNTVLCNNTLCGIQNHRGSGVSIVGCVMYGNAHGLRMQEYAHDVTVTGCVIRDNTVTGVNILSNSNKLSLVGNIITKNASDGVQAVTTNKLLVANNQISRNGQRGIYLEGTHQCEIVGNQITNNNQNTDPSNSDWYFAGISLVNSNNNKVANNYCSKDDGTMKYGIYERSSSNKNVINDNYTLGSTNNVYKSGANSIERNNDLFV